MLLDKSRGRALRTGVSRVIMVIGSARRFLAVHPAHWYRHYPISMRAPQRLPVR